MLSPTRDFTSHVAIILYSVTHTTVENDISHVSYERREKTNLTWYAVYSAVQEVVGAESAWALARMMSS